MQEKNKTQLQKLFEQHKIDYSRPGFYDTPEFKAVEAKNPPFLETYAAYVDSLEFSEEYLERARRIGIEAATFLFEELVKDGRKGACIDASGVLQRMLERDGVWNYQVCGGVRIKFPEESRIPDSHFWPLVHPNNPAQTGHAWLRVPPFAALDITLPVQPYSTRIAGHFDGFVAEERFAPYEAVAGDLYENELVELHVEKYGRPPTLANLAPKQLAFMESFPAFGVEYRSLRLKYIPMNITAMDAELGEMRNLCLSGKYPLELYDEFQKNRANH